MKRTLWKPQDAAARGLYRLRSLPLVVSIMFVLLNLSACAPNPRAPGASSAPPGISRADVIADVDAAIAALSEMHPNLYWRADPGEVARRKQGLIAQVPDSPSALDVYVTFMGLTSVFDDAHVSVASVPPQLRGADGVSLYDMLADSGGLLPALFDPYSDSLSVRAVAPPEHDLRAGEVIASINGTPVAQLLARLERMLPGSAGTKRFEARREFSKMLWILGVTAPFHVELAAGGGSSGRTLVLEGTSRKELTALAEEGSSDPIRYRLLEDGIGLIDFDDMSESPDRFAKRLVEIFDRVKRDHPHGLVIDLRRNGGGNSGLGDLLLAFMNDKVYRPFAERRWKVSRGCQQWYQSYAEDERRYFLDYLAEPAGKTLVTKQLPGRRMPSVNRVFYGPVAALIGPGTNSSAMILADAMQTYGLARIFGQPTTEPANMYGEVCQATLPNSGINIAAPSAFFIRANGDSASDGPIMPDVAADGASDGSASDAALNAARGWLRSQAGT